MAEMVAAGMEIMDDADRYVPPTHPPTHPTYLSLTNSSWFQPP